MRTADFDFELPPELIAQAPAPQRDQSRLLVLRRDSGQLEHRSFGALLEYLQAGDVLVLNNSRVIPARLRGANARSGGQFEMLLLEENATNDWWVMLRPGKRARVGTQIILRGPEAQRGSRVEGRGEDRSSGGLARPSPLAPGCASEAAAGCAPAILATVVETNAEGHRRLRFTGAANILEALESMGEVPLPPYISRAGANRMDQDHERYQTVFAQPPGSVAAPTAGLHFTDALLDEIRARGVQVCFLTLHVGLGTFAPVKAESIAAHVMHEERYHLDETTARVINDAKRAGHRVFAVGTTTVRVLETLARMERSVERGNMERAEGGSNAPTLHATNGRTRIFIYPPYEFKVVDALLTNFHLPRSTLLMLVSAFATPGQTRGRELILSAYAEAVRQRYRFFSYGDAMLIL